MTAYMNISSNNAIAMEGDKNARLVNNGTINLGTSGTTDTGMIGMQLDSGTTADAVIENNGSHQHLRQQLLCI